jgi:hypothetical protein
MLQPKLYKRVALLVVWLVLTLGSLPGCAQALAPYSDFQAMQGSQLLTLQIKLMPIGIPDASQLPMIVITSNVNQPDVSVFAPFRQNAPCVHYSRERGGYSIARANPPLLKALIDSVASVPSITAGGISDPCWISFAMFNSSGGNRVFEAILDIEQSAILLEKMRSALAPGNKDALLLLANFACAIGVPDPRVPTDVTSKVTVALSGYRLDRSSGKFVTTATVTNVDQAVIQGPVSLVFTYNEMGFYLHNRTGPPCVLPGQAYLDLPVESLVPQQPVTVKLEFESPDHLDIRVTPKVYAGPGAR